MSKKLPTNIQKGVDTIFRSATTISSKQEFKALSAATQSRYSEILVAMTLSNAVLDATTDEQFSIFYKSSQEQFANDVLFAVNEKWVIDVDAVNDMVFPFWAIRHEMIRGRIAPWQYEQAFHEFLPGEKFGQIKEFMEFMRGL